MQIDLPMHGEVCCTNVTTNCSTWSQDKWHIATAQNVYLITDLSCLAAEPNVSSLRDEEPELLHNVVEIGVVSAIAFRILAASVVEFLA